MSGSSGRPAAPASPGPAPATAAVPAVTEFLVCVYYRVAADALDAVIDAVRDIQRGIARDASEVRTELHVRSAQPVTGTPSGAPDADATLMETYRLAERASEPRLAAFLDLLADRMQPLAPRVHGIRHVEVFRPCVSSASR